MKKQTKKRKKSSLLVLPLLLAAGLLLPIGAFAQDGLFDRGLSDEAYYGFGGSGLLRDNGLAYSLSNQSFGSLLGGENVTNQGFGGLYVRPGITNQSFNTPLGSGMFVLLAASAGYATVKSRKRNKKQNKK